MATAANDNQRKYRISWVIGGPMLAIAAIFDAVQIFFNLTVFLAIGSYAVDFLYIAIFPLWFYICGVSLLGGKKSGMKLASVVGGVVLESTPIVSAVPGITMSVLGMIIASRMEDRMLQKGDSIKVKATARFPRTTKVQHPANDNDEAYAEAA